MATDPMDQLTTLGKLLRDRASTIGMDMHQFMAIPDLDGNGINMVQATFIVDVPVDLFESQPETEEEKQAKADLAALEGIMGATSDAEKEAEKNRIANEARERALKMQERLQQEGKGFLDD